MCEELGCSVEESQLRKIGNYSCVFKYSDDYIDKEYAHIYVCELNMPLMNLKLQKEEVAAIQLIPISNFKRIISKDEVPVEYVPYPLKYYTLVFNSFQKFL